MLKDGLLKYCRFRILCFNINLKLGVIDVLCAYKSDCLRQWQLCQATREITPGTSAKKRKEIAVLTVVDVHIPSI